MLITIVMIHKQRAIVRAFEQAGATTVATACRAEQLGLQPGMAWYQLMARAVLRCPGEGRYFLDVANWQRLRRRRRMAAAVVVAVLVALLLVALVLRFR
ncbi:MAG: hypothetical protein WA777_10980 [Rhodanobacter sp.]